MKVISNQIEYWNNVSFAAALFAGVAGTVATIMIALQGDDNRYWTRPIGIIATSLVTGITALMTSFHIAQNTDKYIDGYRQIVEITNNFEHQIRSAKTDDAQDELRFQYASKLTGIKADLLKVKGSLSLVSAPEHAAPPAK